MVILGEVLVAGGSARVCIVECANELRVRLLETMSRASVSGQNRLQRLSGIATSYSEARDRVLMSVSACRSDRYELIAVSYSRNETRARPVRRAVRILAGEQRGERGC